MVDYWYFDVVLSRDLTKKSTAVSCCNNLRDVLALELGEPVDNPGTTIGIFFFSVALAFSAI